MIMKQTPKQIVRNDLIRYIQSLEGLKYSEIEPLNVFRDNNYLISEGYFDNIRKKSKQLGAMKRNPRPTHTKVMTEKNINYLVEVLNVVKTIPNKVYVSDCGRYIVFRYDHICNNTAYFNIDCTGSTAMFNDGGVETGPVFIDKEYLKFEIYSTIIYWDAAPRIV